MHDENQKENLKREYKNASYVQWFIEKLAFRIDQ
jgi:hypothetical protein